MGKRLRNIRLLHDYTQEQMADYWNRTAYYGKVERGNHGLSLKACWMKSWIWYWHKLFIDRESCSQITIEEAIKCPKRKRYDLEQLIKYALNLYLEAFMRSSRINLKIGICNEVLIQSII